MTDLAAEAREKQHEQNLRDLAMIRDDPGWALTAVQQWRRLSEQVDALSARLAQAEQDHDRMRSTADVEAELANEEHERAEKAEARLREYEEALAPFKHCYNAIGPKCPSPREWEFLRGKLWDAITAAASVGDTDG